MGVPIGQMLGTVIGGLLVAPLGWRRVFLIVGLPGLAIAQLSRAEGVAAVLVTRWEWDGRARSAVEVELPPMSAPV